MSDAEALAALALRVTNLEAEVSRLRDALDAAQEPTDQLAAGFEQFRKRARRAAHSE